MLTGQSWLAVILNLEFRFDSYSCPCGLVAFNSLTVPINLIKSQIFHSSGGGGGRVL